MSNARKLADNLPTEGPLTGRNMVINGDMRIDQRNGGSAVTGHNTNLFPVDRFRCTENTGGSVDMQRVQDAPVGFYYSLKFTVTGTDTSLTGTEYVRALHPIEGSNIGHLNWGTSNAKTCTLSFYVKSSVAGQYYVNIFNGSANRIIVKGYTIDAANTWVRKIISVAGATSGSWSTSTGAGIYIGWMQGTGPDYIVSSTDTWGGSFDMVGANQVNLLATNGATWQLTGVQFEVGANNATPFEHEQHSVTLAKCQRYYFQETTTSTDSSGRLGVASGGSTVVFDHTLPVQMRTKPSVSLTSTNLRIGDTVAQGFTTTSGTVSLSTYSGSQSVTYTLGGFSGLTSYRTYLHEPDGSSTGMVKFDAEL